MSHKESGRHFQMKLQVWVNDCNVPVPPAAHDEEGSELAFLRLDKGNSLPKSEAP